MDDRITNMEYDLAELKRKTFNHSLIIFALWITLFIYFIGA